MNLPDTIDFGEHTWNKIVKLYNNRLSKKKIFISAFKFDIGIYHIDYIKLIKSFLVSSSCKVNFPFTKQDVVNLKFVNLFFEDCILGREKFSSVIYIEKNNIRYIYNKKNRQLVQHEITNFDIFKIIKKYNILPDRYTLNNSKVRNLYIYKNKNGNNANVVCYFRVLDIKKYIQNNMSPLPYWKKLARPIILKVK